MSLFFEKIDQEPVIIPEEGDWKHFNPNDPVGSITHFVEELQRITPAGKLENPVEFRKIKWPYEP